MIHKQTYTPPFFLPSSTHPIAKNYHARLSLALAAH